MFAVKAKVVGGRLVVNEPTELPEGTELCLVTEGVPGVGDDGATHYLPADTFTPEEWAQITRGEFDPVDPQAALAWMRGEGPDPWLER